MTSLHVDEDIRKASTIDSDFYNEQEYFELAKEKIFSLTWQFIMDDDSVSLAGQLVPQIILPGYLNEPIVFIRDKEDKLSCLSNVCTHRGNILVEHATIDSQIRCRYHGRKFKLDGEFISMPEFENVENFPSEKDCLPKIPFGSWNKFLFASLNPSIHFDEAIAEMKKRLNWLPLNEFKLASNLSREYLVKANWALYCENYLEGFHIPFVHNSLNKAIDYGSYTTELFRYSSLQLGISKGGDEIFDLPKDAVDYGKKIAAYYFWVFPNMMFNFYPWGLSINVIRPLASSLTKVSFITYIWKENLLGTGAGSDLDKVEREDEAIVENVQTGVRSRFYGSGRYSPTREQGTHHFHRLICEFMNQ
jgi:choline monooxygenase